MGAQKNTITINGRVYDTKSGMLISSGVNHNIVTPSQKNITQPALHATPRNVDGVVRKRGITHSLSNQPQPRQKKKISNKVSRKTPSEATTFHQKTEVPKTLMRHVVQKPVTQKTDPTTKAVSIIVTQPAHKIIQTKHASIKSRQATVTKSSSIHKFFPKSQHNVTVKTAFIPVQSAPPEEKDLSAPAPNKLAPPIAHSSSRFLQSAKTTTLLEDGIRNASSHKNNKYSHKNSKNTLIKYVASFSAVFILGLFFAYNNAPNFSMKMASKEAGFSASIPRYKPTGYSLKRSIQYQTGKVVVSYGSNLDEQKYSVTQIKTNMDPSSMISSYFGYAKDKYITNIVKGRTIYIYNGHNATWIDGGIWYNIEGSAQLSNDQLLKIAASI